MINENYVRIRSICACFLCCPMKISIVFNFLCVQILFQSTSSQLSFRFVFFLFSSQNVETFPFSALCGSVSVHLCDRSTLGSVWSSSGHKDDVLSLPMKLARGVKHLSYRRQPY